MSTLIQRLTMTEEELKVANAWDSLKKYAKNIKPTQPSGLVVEYARTVPAQWVYSRGFDVGTTDTTTTDGVPLYSSTHTIQNTEIDVELARSLARQRQQNVDQLPTANNDVNVYRPYRSSGTWGLVGESTGHDTNT